MGIVRVEKTKNYTVMSNYHLRDKSLSLKAKGLMSLMLSLPDDWDYSVAGLVTQVKEERTAVSSAINELIEHGYMTREVVRENGRISDWNYTVYETPTESVLPSENLIVENLMLENHTQLNTDNNQIKTKKGTVTGASSKNHSQVYKQRNTLSDDLESGKNIDEQTKIKKKQSEEEKADRKIDKTSYSDKVKDLLKQFFRQSFYSKDVKRMKNASDLTGKLMRLDELVKKGEDPEKVVQQSIDKNWNAFYEYKQESTTSRKGGELLNDNIVGTDLEDAKKRYQEAIDNEEEWF